MSKFADKVAVHYQGKQMKPLEVPEWGLTLYIGPLTVGQLIEINKPNDPFHRTVKQITIRAKDAEGFPLFDTEDESKLITHGIGPYGPEAIVRVARQIQAMDGEQPEEKKA